LAEKILSEEIPTHITSVVYKKYSGRNTHLKFQINVVQKLFLKYLGPTPSEVLQIRTIKTLFPDPAGRFKVRHFPDVNTTTGKM
jgi:hypothetical protein